MTTTVSAVNLPFEQAIDFFGQKTNATSEHWTDVWQRANARAFTVAGAATDALVGDFRAEITKALEQGTTLAEFRKGFDQIVAKHGWEHTGTPGWRSRIIYETNLSMAYAAGRWAQQTAPETLAAFPFWQYVHSGSLHPRLNHLAWDGLTLRADDDWWSTHYPPNGWRCGCRVRPLSARGLARQGKSAPDQAPPIAYRDWTNPKTGEVHQVPNGIDPSFDYNPGQAWLGTKPQIPPNATFEVPPIRPALAESATPARARPRRSAERPIPGLRNPFIPSDEPVSVAPARPVPGIPLKPTRSKPRPKPVVPAEAPSWPWDRPPPRTDIAFSIDDEGLAIGRRLGIWKTADEAKAMVERLMAGTPRAVPLEVTVTKARPSFWSTAERVEIRGLSPKQPDGGKRDVVIMREIGRDPDVPASRRRTTVEHSLFQISKRFQGGGHAKAMMRAAVEQYVEAGIQKIEVHANIDVGGHAWAKLGFRPKDPEGLRLELRERLAEMRFGPKDDALLRSVIADASDADLMYDLARATGADGRPLGREFLAGTDWYGEIDLTDPAMLARLKEALS